MDLESELSVPHLIDPVVSRIQLQGLLLHSIPNHVLQRARPQEEALLIDLLPQTTLLRRRDPISASLPPTTVKLGCTTGDSPQVVGFLHRNWALRFHSLMDRFKKAPLLRLRLLSPSSTLILSLALTRNLSSLGEWPVLLLLHSSLMLNSEF